MRDSDTAKSLVAINYQASGLGNRMHFTLSAASLANALGRELKVVWPLGPSFACPAGRIWQDMPGEIIPAESLPGSPQSDYLTDWRVVKNDAWLELSEDTIYISGYGGLALPAGSADWGSFLRRISPVSEISERVSTAWRAIPSDNGVLGVSVRASPSSHAVTLEQSPVSWYERRIDEFVAMNPDVNIFLSSDDRSVEQRLSMRYGERLSHLDKVGSHNSVLGVQEAVCDLYVLASCSYMLTPYRSSFPNMARKLSADSVPMRNSHDIINSHGSLALSVARDPLQPSLSRQKIPNWGSWSD